MKSMKQNEDAVSPILATVLILAVGVSTMAFIQRHYVPVWNDQEENEQFDKAYQDMIKLIPTIEDTSNYNIPRTAVITTGLKYSEHPPFFNNKPGIYGAIRTDKTNTITVNYIYANTTLSKTYQSNIIEYQLPGHANIVYENGRIIKDYKDQGYSSPQRIETDSLNIPVILSDMTGISSIEPYTMTLNPLSKNEIEATSINITMETRYPKVWNITGDTVVFKPGGNVLNLPEIKTNIHGIYTGMITVTTDPFFNKNNPHGVGSQIIGEGDVWVKIPNSTDMKSIILSNITIAQGCNPKDEIISFKITDTQGKFWFMTATFDDATHIGNIRGRNYLTTYDYTIPVQFDSTSRINLSAIPLSLGSYRNSEISSNNSLTNTWLGSTVPGHMQDSCVINYALILE